MPTLTRPSIHVVLLQTAEVMAQRATCSRLSVGAVLARDTRIVATGYNGAPAGMTHCTHSDDESCGVSVHAEANAIAFAARYGVSTAGSTLYVTHAPCRDCSKLVINAGVSQVYYGRRYRDDSGLDLLAAAGVSIVSLK